MRQQNLSRWLEEARSLPWVAAAKPSRRQGSVEQKARILAEASKLTGEQLSAYLEREGVKLADFERWRLALEQDGLDRGLPIVAIGAGQPTAPFLHF